MAKNIDTGPRKLGRARNPVRTNFTEADLARISASDAADNLTGRAIHEIGTEISKTDFEKFKPKDPLEGPKEPAYGVKDLGEVIPKANIPTPEVTTAKPLKLQTTKLRVPTSGIQKYTPTITATMGPPLLAPNSFGDIYPTIQTERVGLPTFAEDVSGPRGYTLEPLSEMIRNAQPGSALSPINRLDPEMELLSQGDPIYGVGEGKSFASGINIGKEQRNYARQVWENQKNNTEDKFGDLMDVPEGENPDVTSQLKNYGMEIMREWSDLQSKKMELNPEDFVAQEMELVNRSKNIKALRNSLIEQANTWSANKDNASVSTPIESRDFFETISNNKGSLKIENVNGVLTVTGKTQGGKEVSIPGHKIINGENVFRFNEKVDIYGDLLDPLTTQLEKYKTDKEINFGISKELIPFEELEPRIDSFLKTYLKDRTAVQSILGDGYGYTYEQQIAKEKEGVNLRQVAADALKEDIKRMLEPAYKQKDIQADPRIAAKAQIARATQAKQPKMTQQQKSLADARKQVDQIGQLSSENIQQYNDKIGKSGYKIREKEGKYYLVTKDKKTGKLIGTPYSDDLFIQIYAKEGVVPQSLPVLNKN